MRRYKEIKNYGAIWDRCDKAIEKAERERRSKVGWSEGSEGSERSELPNASLCVKLAPLTCRFAPRLTLFAIRFAHLSSP